MTALVSPVILYKVHLIDWCNCRLASMDTGRLRNAGVLYRVLLDQTSTHEVDYRDTPQ